MAYDTFQEAAEAWFNDEAKTKQDLLAWYADNGGTESLDDPEDPSILREDWGDVVMDHYIATVLTIKDGGGQIDEGAE
jgi:hypothetical protein